MPNSELLIEKLNNYGKSDMYPFHMPGHKRRGDYLNNPFSIDITEIENFDNLHHPEDILLQCEERASKLYGANKSFYLVNGSTCGILTAISAVTKPGDKILVARNSHQSVFHAAAIRRLKVFYVYPMVLDEGIQGEIQAEEVKNALEENPDIKAVVITSPTYEGVISDIKAIAELAHENSIPLIVDEAHGAHLNISEEFLPSAVEEGADIVVNSLHKTLPCLTQTAILHLKSEIVKEKEIRKFLDIFQTSSPSYLFMANIDKCVSEMLKNGKEVMHEYIVMMHDFFSSLARLKNIQLIRKDNMDISKIVISVNHTNLTGTKLNRILHDEYHLEMEMVTPDYVLAMTSVCDTKDGLKRLENALLEIDKRISQEKNEDGKSSLDYVQRATMPMTKKIELYEAFELKKTNVTFDEGINKISGGFVYLYPPDIPILVPGEEITEEFIGLIKDMEREGLHLKGVDYDNQSLEIVLL